MKGAAVSLVLAMSLAGGGRGDERAKELDLSLCRTEAQRAIDITGGGYATAARLRRHTFQCMIRRGWRFRWELSDCTTGPNASGSLSVLCYEHGATE
jgi:hypothetical protein